MHDVMMGGKMTDRIGGGSVSGEKKRLASTTAIVDLASVATPARIGHPVGAAKTLKHRGVKPDLFQCLIVNAGELKARNLTGRLAR